MAGWSYSRSRVCLSPSVLPKTCTKRRSDQNRPKLRTRAAQRPIEILDEPAIEIGDVVALIVGAEQREALLRWTVEAARRAVLIEGGHNDGTREDLDRAPRAS